MLLRNEPNSLQKTGVCETVNDCHKMVFTIFCLTFIRLPPPPQNIRYRNYKGFNESIFCHGLDQALLKEEIQKLIEDPFSKFIEIFQEILYKHVPLKSKQVNLNGLSEKNF